jgi:hypothetical protein
MQELNIDDSSSDGDSPRLNLHSTLNQAYIRDLLKDHIKSEVEAMPLVTK